MIYWYHHQPFLLAPILVQRETFYSNTTCRDKVKVFFSRVCYKKRSKRKHFSKINCIAFLSYFPPWINITRHVTTMRLEARYSCPRLSLRSSIFIGSWETLPYFSVYFLLLIWTIFFPFLPSVEVVQFSIHVSYIIFWTSKGIPSLFLLSLYSFSFQLFTESINRDYLMFSLLASHLKKFSSSNCSPNRVKNMKNIILLGITQRS